ncbi:MAG: MerR family transcriptional regulator [Anaerolineaceae bacterium]|nr:MerR family transcriptional regulator [Anaerolineaceae bacterium]
MAADTFDIQKLVTESGVARRTIYFYVQQGLLPPPQGAGLAAYYTEDHLLRLKLIPILRVAGLRLDDIRERFTQMSIDEMRQQVSDAASRAVPDQPAPSMGCGRVPASAPVPFPAGRALGWSEQHFRHYSLPAGITLVVPEQMSPLDRQRLNQLLQAARQIFSAPNAQFVSMETGTPDPGQEHSAAGDSQV